jgi:hypothetical protein
MKKSLACLMRSWYISHGDEKWGAGWWSHYGKNCSCRVAQPLLCAKRLGTRQLLALPCSTEKEHGKDLKHGNIWKKNTAKKQLRQRSEKEHGKELNTANFGQDTRQRSATRQRLRHVSRASSQDGAVITTWLCCVSLTDTRQRSFSRAHPSPPANFSCAR